MCLVLQSKFVWWACSLYGKHSVCMVVTQFAWQVSTLYGMYLVCMVGLYI